MCIIAFLQQKKGLKRSPEYKEIDKLEGKATEVQYAVLSSQALSVKDKTKIKPPLQYVYASINPISVSTPVCR